MTLNEVWFILFVFIIAGYLILDGFDMGVGILLVPLAKTDVERRTFLNSIGPVWDGNEVWLVLGGGVLFAVFPLVYASMFSGFYLAFMLVLLVLILRTVALEFRSKERSPRWRSTWDAVFGIASAGLAFLFGVAFGNVLSGVPIDADGNMHVSLIDLLTPFALLVGVTTVFMFAMHGSIYLIAEDRRRAPGTDQANDAPTDRHLLRPQHACRRCDGPVPSADHGPLHGADLAGDLPGAGAPRAG